MGTCNDDIAAKVGNGVATIDVIKQTTGRYADQAPAVGDAKSPPPSTVKPFGATK